MWWNSRTWISLTLSFISKILSRFYSAVLIHDHTADQGQPRQKTILRFEPRHELYSRERHCPSRSKRRERTAAVGRIGKRTLACFTRVAFTCFFFNQKRASRTRQCWPILVSREKSAATSARRHSVAHLPMSRPRCWAMSRTDQCWPIAGVWVVWGVELIPNQFYFSRNRQLN